MRQRKALKDLTIKDNFMFSAVMSDPKNCKPMLERILGITIDSIEVDLEKCIVYNPEYKGVRLDILAIDEHKTRYNVEMQIADKHDLPLRARYYHSQMDMEVLQSGIGYETLPMSIVIFICDFDPFRQGKYCYTIEHRCKETGENIDDKSATVFLNTCGKNAAEISPELLRFLTFVHTGTEDIPEQNEDLYIRQLQESIENTKKSREMGGRYVLFTELLKDEFEEGYKEGEKSGFDKGEKFGFDKGVKSGFDKGEKSGVNKGKITIIKHFLTSKGWEDHRVYELFQQADADSLGQWLITAANTDSPEDFLEKIKR